MKNERIKLFIHMQLIFSQSSINVINVNDSNEEQTSYDRSGVEEGSKHIVFRFTPLPTIAAGGTATPSGMALRALSL